MTNDAVIILEYLRTALVRLDIVGAGVVDEVIAAVQSGRKVDEEYQEPLIALLRVVRASYEG